MALSRLEALLLGIGRPGCDSCALVQCSLVTPPTTWLRVRAPYPNAELMERTIGLSALVGAQKHVAPNQAIETFIWAANTMLRSDTRYDGLGTEMAYTLGLGRQVGCIVATRAHR